MKLKYIKRLKRMLSMLLIVVLMATSVELTAFAVESPTGATNPSQKGDAGVTSFDPNITAFMRPAWLVYIQTVQNAGSVSVDSITEVKNSAIEAMLYNYPQDYVTGDNSFYKDRCAVIIDKGGASYNGNVNIYKPDGSLSGAIKHVYHVNGSAPSDMSMSIISDDVLPSDEYIDKFRNGQMTMSEYNAALSSIGRGGVSIDTAIKNFVSHFKDIGSFAQKMSFEAGSAETQFPQIVDVIRNTQMLNLLGTINAMCGNSYNAAIENYLVAQNKNGSDEFYIPVVIAGFVANANGQPPAFYSLPTYYHKTYGADTDALFNIPDLTAGQFGNYGSSEAATYEDKVHTYYTEQSGAAKSTSKFFMYRVGSWWAHAYGSTSMTGMKGQAYTCMPTDPEDQMRGNLGYTYITFGGEGSVPTETLGQFNVTASSEQKNVTAPNTSVAALVNVDLTCTDQQKQLIRDAFDQEKKKGYEKADIIVDYSFSAEVGNGSSTPLMDSVLTAGATLSGGNKVTLPDMTFETLKPYLEGSKLIQTADSGILINGATANKYIASVTIKFPDNSFKMIAKGKKIETETKGSDTVMWGLNDMTGFDEYFHYYSGIGKNNIQDNYVEIKHNVPGDEQYEAMAGIPTTEDAYVGFGITEFMVNMDGKKETSPASTRKYTYTYTADNCYGIDTPCVYSCPGNHKSGSGGCGKMISPPSYDSEGNEVSPAVYCKSGSFTKSDFNCADDGKYEYEYVCSCSGTVLAADSGTATYGPGYTQCIGVDGSDDGVGGTTWGCQHTEHLNTTHCGVTFTGVVEQPIDEFPYLDITDLDLWRMNSLKADLNQNLFSNSDLEWDPGTGYFTYYKKDKYESDNGRLVFKTSTNDTASGSTNNSSVYGDSKSTCPNPSTAIISWDEAAALASTWMNETLAGSTVTAMVVSDYVSLATTVGYNNVLYHSYLSDDVPIISSGFTAPAYSETHAIDLASVTGNTITFSTKPALQDMWQNNTYSSAKWTDKDITRSGYNGQYNSPSTKWNNNNTKTAVCPLITVMTAWQPRATRAIHPNSKNLNAPTIYPDGFTNLATTKTGLDINDVMNTEDRTWPQGSEPRVQNGKWDTGRCYIKAERVVDEGTPKGGIDYTDYEQYNEVGYTAGKTEVNDIVVHNPVSTQNAHIICNDEKYDLRTDAVLAAGGDPVNELDFCPGNASCNHQVLTCTTTPIEHTAACYANVNTNTVHSSVKTIHTHTSACTHVHTDACYVGCPGGSIITSSKPHRQNHEGCGYGVNGNPNCNNGIDGVDYSTKCSKCGYIAWNSARFSRCPNRTLICGKSTAVNAYCTNDHNTHTCTAECYSETQTELICTDPHHIEPGEVWDYDSASNHYEYGDTRCWSACNDDNKHKVGNGTIVNKNGAPVNISDTFINLDREFKIYFPNTGDFADNPNLLGILDTTSTRGKGYYDNMDCSKWTRDKYVVFPFSVIFKDENGNLTKQASANQPIRLEAVPEDEPFTWTFYCPLANNELNNAQVRFLSIASNAQLTHFIDESDDITNKARGVKHAARHTARKYQYIDVLGTIGGLTLEDTGDFRFATLFKKAKDNDSWLIKNLVPEVHLNLPNKIVSDSIDVRNEVACDATDWHDAYGTQYSSTGGKAYQHLALPLVPKYNPIVALRNQPLRPGYKLYMDISTIGNYYGENIDENGNYLDSNMYYMMQITPRYWALDLDTGDYHPVDAYMGKSNDYTPVAYFDADDEANISEYYMYLDWVDENLRRNYTSSEKDTTSAVIEFYSSADTRLRSPGVTRDILGTAQRLRLNDLDRTFIGSTLTYGVDRNPENYFPDEMYMRQAQRWHWTTGLPSSTVFVKRNEDCTSVNIEEIKNMNAVIVCTMDIKVRGEVWTLEYDGTSINNNGIQVTEGGTVFNPPIDPVTGEVCKDPIVAIYTNEQTAADDLRVEGSH